MKKENIPVLIGISLPVTLVLAFMVYLFLPNIMPGTDYNFIYTVGENRYSPWNEENYKYEVVGNQIVYTGDQSNPSVELYLYDTEKDTSRLISISEANEFHIYPGPSSPDGFTAQYEFRRNDFFFFYGSSGDSGYYIRKKNRSKKLTGLHWNYHNSYFRLIGWIKQ